MDEEKANTNEGFNDVLITSTGRKDREKKDRCR